jgi:signal transduction histidine kinase
LNRLLDDILTLSRSQRIGVPSEEVDGESIVSEALKRLEGKINATHARIHVAKDFQGLRVDKTWATQAVYNLIANALKFTSEGAAPDVEIAPYWPPGPGRNAIGIVVRDRGPGIAPEHTERIFQLFQRAVGREVEGTGAGLAIVRQIAERHGGSAWVEPRPAAARICHYVRRRIRQEASSIMDTNPWKSSGGRCGDDILLEQEALADAKLVNLMCRGMAKKPWPTCGARASTKTSKCRASFS